MGNKAQPATILVVEDELNNRNLIEMRLLGLGYEVQTASNGLHALEKLNDPHLDIDLVITDIKMPGLDGIQLVQEMKKNKNKNISDIPVIIMTAFAEGSLIGQGHKAGVKDVLLKPFPFNMLLQRIKENLGEQNISPT